MRASKSELDSVLGTLNTWTNHSIDFSYDVQMGKYRLTRSNGAMELSPRLSRGEMLDWMCAFVEGMVLGSRLEHERGVVVGIK